MTRESILVGNIPRVGKVRARERCRGRKVEAKDYGRGKWERRSYKVTSKGAGGIIFHPGFHFPMC